MKAVVVAGAPLVRSPLVQRYLHEAELIVAADGGAGNLRSLGMYPHVVVGDFDSLDARFRGELEDHGAELKVFPVQKDKTDLHLAVEEALRRGATQVAILGAEGGPRLDHSIANMMLLSLDQFADVDLRVIHGQAEARVIRAAAEFEGEPEHLVTLLALSDTVEGIDTEGLAYPLRNGTLRRGDSLGVSNVMTGERAGVRIRSGVLLAVQQHRYPE